MADMKYKVALKKSKEGYSVSCPGLPGCWSQGPNRMLSRTFNYETSKGTNRFHPDKPLPVALVRKIVETRIAENAAKCAARLRKARKTKGR